MEFGEERNDNRDKVLRLAKEGKIKHSTKYIEKATDEKIEEIYKEYKVSQMEELNSKFADDLISQFSNLMSSSTSNNCFVIDASEVDDYGVFQYLSL